MSLESYRYDEVVGLYGHSSHRLLAKGVIQDIIRYEESHERVDFVTMLPHLDLGVTAIPSEEFRIGSLVESKSAKIGYALAVAPPNEADPATMGGLFYYIDREEPMVLDTKDLLIARPETYQGNQDYKDAVEDLMRQFSKSELEIVMRILGKLSSSLEVSRRLQAAEEYSIESSSVLSMMQQAAQIKRDKGILQRTAHVESHVLSALYNYRQHRLQAHFPPDRPLRSPSDATETIGYEHLAEWQEFNDAATRLIARETDPGQAATSVNIRHEQAGKSYYLKLAVEYGHLTGVQILCDDTGAWQTQGFDLRSADDETDLNHVSPMWDKREVLDSFQGDIIDDSDYEYYRSLAEQSITTRFHESDNLIQLPVKSLKRPAA